jgi:beta-glucuronidase
LYRFGSVHYTAAVYVNGQNAGNHSGGHISFEMDITSLLNFSAENWITVAVNNTLTRQVTITLLYTITHPFKI